MSQLRILHVVFSSRIAGSERYCVDLANRQAEAGQEVHVAGMRRSPIAAALAPGVRFHGFSVPFFRRFQLGRLADRLGVDVCHGHLSAACKALGPLSRRHRTVATLHVGYKAHQHARLDGLICVNHAQARRLTNFRGVARTIPNWLPQADRHTSGPGLREELGLSKDTLLVGAVGRLHPSKGMDVLISAFRAVAPAKAALVVLGEGPQRQELERLAGGDSRIHLPGFRSAIQPCLESFDLFVSPSREETFGLAIVEAMSAKLPIVATAAEGPAEFLREHPVTLVAPGSMEELATALGAACGRFERGELPKVAYDLEGFDPESRVASISELYRHVIKARQRGAANQKSGVAVAT